MAAANEAALAHNGHGSAARLLRMVKAACLLRMVTAARLLRMVTAARLLRMVTATLPLKATATRLLRTQQLSTTPVACTNSTVT